MSLLAFETIARSFRQLRELLPRRYGLTRPPSFRFFTAAALAANLVGICGPSLAAKGQR
jgi:hypothetical protein